MYEINLCGHRNDGKMPRRFNLLGVIVLGIAYYLVEVVDIAHAFIPSTKISSPALLYCQIKPSSRTVTSVDFVHTTPMTSSSSLKASDVDEEEAQRLMDQVAKIRAQIAALEGKSIDEVETEATQRKEEEKTRLENEQQKKKIVQLPSSTNRDDGRFLYVPCDADEQTRQATAAVERAFKDGITRQTVRLALVREGKSTMEDEEWPGGAREMYREAGRPLTEELLRMVRAQPPMKELSTDEADQKETENERQLNKMLPPDVKAEDIWDFDGSALITAKAAGGPSADVCAMVFPNTDVKYLNDIQSMDEQMKERLFLLVNPFWRNVDSWGFNILAPNAKKRAQEVVFDDDKFIETYVMLRFSARGERCVALKVYPYDWQLYAYLEDDSRSYGGNIVEEAVRLGASKDEPTSAQFTDLLNERPEFKMSRNMRQINRMM